jgi:GTP cyclohydrolase II
MASEIEQLNGHSKEINGHPAALTTERAVEELRRGRAIQLLEGDRWLLVAAVETIESPLLDRFKSLNVTGMRLLITAERSRAVGLTERTSSPMAISFPSGIELEELRSLAGVESHVPIEKALLRAAPAESPTNVEAGFRLAKLGRLLPALVAVETTQVLNAGVLKIRAQDIEHDSPSSLNNVNLISRARVPLLDAVDSEIVLFRQKNGFGEHLAIVIGGANAREVVPVRLHSACLTGDVLGSLRCDCGDQLKRAVGRMASVGGGVLLYLDQEGRGIGLANKLRAYALQDAGLDTVDADQHLGFLPDERSYDVAASMLHELGIKRIRLLTNNPSKISALTEHGIDVVGRLPLIAPVNSHNQRYLKAKLDRAGHLAE